MRKVALISCLSFLFAVCVYGGSGKALDRRENYVRENMYTPGEERNDGQDSTIRPQGAAGRLQDTSRKPSAAPMQARDTMGRPQSPGPGADSGTVSVVDTTAVCRAPVNADRFNLGSGSQRPGTAGASAAIPYGPSVSAFMDIHPYYKAAENTLRLTILERRPERKEWIFYLFTGLLFYLALLRLAFPKYFADLFRVFFNASLRQKQIRDQLIQEPLPSLLLNIFFVVSGGIFLSFLLVQKKLAPGYPQWMLPFACMLLIALVYLVKFIVIRALGWLFGKREAVDAYLFIVFMVNKIAGMVLLPFAFLLAYAGKDEASVLVFLSLAALGILGIYRLVKSYGAVHKALRINQLHFILFVVAFEVVPILLLYKGLNSLL